MLAGQEAPRQWTMRAEVEQKEARDLSNRHLVPLLLLTVLAAILRASVAFKGGIWSDEGFFLSVIQIPTLSGMIEFLHLHESHPPLFYVVMRLWGQIAGFGERPMLILPIILGAATVPLTYLLGRSLYSPRTALVASAFVAVSAGLVEYSGQIRPYCLLPGLILLSSWSLVRALRLESNGSWIIYGVCTTIALYTHNWVWLVAAGQFAATLLVLFKRETTVARRIAKHFTITWIAIVAAFSPWIPAFLYQAGHAGHAPFLVDRTTGSFGLYLYGLINAPTMLLLGTPPESMRTVFVAACATAVVAAIAASVLGKRRIVEPDSRALDAENRESDVVFITISAVALALAILLSPWSNLLIGRVVASVLPMLLLVFTSWSVHRLMPVNAREGPVAAAMTALVLAMFVLALAPAIRYPRSNFRDVAATLEREMHPTDFLVLASELYAPVFNRYFDQSIEQVDFPNTGRAGLVGFANLYERAVDSLPLASMRHRIVEARHDGRRVWLLSSLRVTEPKPREIAIALRQRNARILWRLRIAQVRQMVVAVYGGPDSVFMPNASTARYDRLKLERFTPPTQ